MNRDTLFYEQDAAINALIDQAKDKDEHYKAVLFDAVETLKKVDSYSAKQIYRALDDKNLVDDAKDAVQEYFNWQGIATSPSECGIKEEDYVQLANVFSAKDDGNIEVNSLWRTIVSSFVECRGICNAPGR